LRRSDSSPRNNSSDQARQQTSESRTPGHFAAQEGDVLALWDGPRQRQAYEVVRPRIAQSRAAFRWAADHDDLDTAASIAVLATSLGSARSSAPS